MARIKMFCCCCAAASFDLSLGSSIDAAEGDELVIDLVDGTGAKNNLELALGLKDALGTVDILDGFLCRPLRCRQSPRRRVAQCAADTTLPAPPMLSSTSWADLR